ncbi:replication initiation protein [Fonticella tunisiensis]|uniref:Replication initiator protein n=1 Tax=Fonticella tunisiensis TaxID=1096341 RepID=A0A4R7KRT5_9CLOT|nr:replication initiation protein [Fonticella tunisiensis]TDT62305.1 replication initiator protein [Fonticella tunisiensis]
MSLYSESSPVNFENSKLTLTFEHPLLKKERFLISYLLELYKKERNGELKLDRQMLMGLLDMDMDELKSFIKKLSKKKLEYCVETNESLRFEGYFSVIDSFLIDEKSVIFLLSREVMLSFKKGNIFNTLHIDHILSFKEKQSYLLYLYLLNHWKEKAELEITLDNLKTILGVGDNYTRFYDFETKILLPIVEDINSNGKYILSYEKIKSGLSSNNKVIGIKFSLIDRLAEKLKNDVNILITIIKKYIDDYDFVYNLLLDSLKKYEYEYVYKNLNYARLNSKNTNLKFDMFLKECIENNVAESKKSHLEPVIKIKKHIPNIFRLQAEVFKQINRFESYKLLDANFFSPLFLRKLYSLKSGETMEVETDLFKISIYYNEDDFSEINIYKFETDENVL